MPRWPTRTPTRSTPTDTPTAPVQYAGEIDPTPEKAPKTRAISSDTDTRDPVNRLAITLDAKGRVQWDRMRESTKAQVRAILTDAETAMALGVSAPIPTVAAPIELALAATGAINQILTLAVARMTGAPRSILESAMPFTAQESQSIAEPLARVMGKYMGTVLTKWADEAALALAVLAVAQAKIMLVQAMAHAPDADRGPRPTSTPAGSLDTVQ